MIKQLTIQGFKDQARTVHLSGLDLVTSNQVNGLGKSAILESFKLALLGELPGRAKNVDDILQYTSFPEMEVSIVAETPRQSWTVERRFIRDAPCGEKRPLRINGIDRKYEEGSRWVRENFGAVSLSFDPFEFLNLNPSRKRQWILSHSPESQSLNPQRISLILAAHLLEKHFGCGILRSLLAPRGLERVEEILPLETIYEGDGFREELERTYRSQDESLWTLVHEILDAALGLWSDALSGEENIFVLLKHLKSEILKLQGGLREQSAALACMGTTGENPGAVEFQDIPRYRKEIRSMSERIENLTIRIEKERQRQETWKRREVRTVFLEEKIAALGDNLRGEMHEALHEMKRSLREKLSDTQPLQEELNRLHRQRAGLVGRLNRAESHFRDISNRLRWKREKLAAIESPGFNCPVAGEIRCDTDITPYRELLGREIPSLTSSAEAARDDVENARRELTACGRSIDRTESAMNGQNASNRETERELRLLEDQIAIEEEESARARGMLKAYRDELRRLRLERQSQTPESESFPLEFMEKEKSDMESLKHEVEKEFSELLREQGKAEVASELNRKKKSAEQRLDVMKAVFDLLGPLGLQGEMAAGIAGGLQREVNQILKLIDADYEFSIDMSGLKFEMGWNRDGKIIPFDTINAAHFILFIVPFLTAVVNRMACVREKSGLPTLKALCIEAESLTPNNLAALLKGLSRMKAEGYLDNVLVAHYHSVKDPGKLYGFQEHILGGKEIPVPSRGESLAAMVMA